MMYQKIRTLLFHSLVPAVLAIMMFPVMVFAQGQSCQVSIPVEIRVNGSQIPADVPYKLVLEGITPGAPVPEATAITVLNGGKASFGPITFTVPNDYQYRIYQKSDPRNRFTFDQTVYTITIRVVNMPDGTLTAEIWAVGDNGKKASELLFTNYYTKPGGGNGDGGGGHSPGGKGYVPTGPGADLVVVTEQPPPLAELVTENEIPLEGLPKTGDLNDLTFWLALFAISGGGLLFLLMLKKRMELEKN